MCFYCVATIQGRIGGRRPKSSSEQWEQAGRRQREADGGAGPA